MENTTYTIHIQLSFYNPEDFDPELHGPGGLNDSEPWDIIPNRDSWTFRLTNCDLPPLWIAQHEVLDFLPEGYDILKLEIYPDDE